MTGKPSSMLFVVTLTLVTCFMSWGIGSATAAGLEKDHATLLRGRYAELGPQLRDNQFKRPIYLNSIESSSQLKGDIYALVGYPFAAVNGAFNDPSHWCDMLILHINTKYCRASASQSGSLIAVSIGRKDYQPLAQASRVEFAYTVATTTPEYFDVGLQAKTGPMGTSDYGIRLEAVSVEDNKTVLHYTYSYSYNLVGDLAMTAYLATIGHDKVGFTTAGGQAGSRPVYIDGVRGVVDRNAIRY